MNTELTDKNLEELEGLRKDLSKCHPRDKQARQVLEIIDWVFDASSTIQSLRAELAAAKEREQGLREALTAVRDWLQEPIGNVIEEDNDGAVSFINKALSQPPQSPWRPIAEAPKDGTEIILGSIVPERVTAGSWIEVTDKDDEEKDFSGWGSWDGGFTNEHPPTHWMPLPQPPTKGES